MLLALAGCVLMGPTTLFAQMRVTGALSGTDVVLSDGTRISHTLGEPVSRRRTVSGALITEGFQQGLVLERISHTTHGQVRAMPNPASDLFRLKVSGDFRRLRTLRILDASGVEHLRLRMADPESPVDVSVLAPGVYLIQCLDEADGILDVFKLIKT